MREFGLLGKQLSHSFSKIYFEEKFERLSISDVCYQLFEIDQIDLLPDLLLAHPNLKGLNVTIPYKQTVIALLDDLSEEARNIGAVNCIKITPNGIIGFNTDAFGFQQSIKPFLEPSHDRALIFGTGGASQAVKYVLEKIGIQPLFVSQNPKEPNCISYKQVNEAVLKHHKLIVNTTPLGMYPNIETCIDIPFQFINESHFVVDLVYNPLETVLIKSAKNQGALVLNGLSMLHQQAEKSWEIWNS